MNDRFLFEFFNKKKIVLSFKVIRLSRAQTKKSNNIRCRRFTITFYVTLIISWCIYKKRDYDCFLLTKRKETKTRPMWLRWIVRLILNELERVIFILLFYFLNKGSLYVEFKYFKFSINHHTYKCDTHTHSQLTSPLNFVRTSETINRSQSESVLNFIMLFLVSINFMFPASDVSLVFTMVFLSTDYFLSH